MKTWFVYYVLEYYDTNGKLVESKGFTQVTAPDEYAARQAIINGYGKIWIKFADGSSSKILKVTVTNTKEAK